MTVTPPVPLPIEEDLYSEVAEAIVQRLSKMTLSSQETIKYAITGVLRSFNVASSPDFGIIVVDECCVCAKPFPHWSLESTLKCYSCRTLTHMERLKSKYREASDERREEQKRWEALATKWSDEGDSHGYNFHQGMVAGGNYIDIFYGRLWLEVIEIEKEVADVGNRTKRS